MQGVRGRARGAQESGAAVKEMEAAAVAYVAALFGTPLLAVKAITDIVDGERATGACARCMVAPALRRGSAVGR